MGSYSFESMAMLIGNMINDINGTLEQSTFSNNCFLYFIYNINNII
jgi:hypothetical protein